MPVLIILTLGIFIPSIIPELPQFSRYLITLSSVTAIYGVFRFVIYRHRSVWIRSTDFLLVFLWGFCWGLMSATDYSDSRLPERYHGQDFIVTGTVLDISVNDNERIKFTFNVSSAYQKDTAQEFVNLRKLLLTHYLSPDPKLNLPIEVGQHWQFMVRLKSTRGLLNSSGFDSQRILVEKGYSSVGYIRNSPVNRHVSRDLSFSLEMIQINIAKLRDHVAKRITKVETSAFKKAILLALTVGDRRMIRSWWDDLSRLGVVHLIVISGLHIGMIGGWGYFLGAMLVRFLRLIQHRQLTKPISETVFVCIPIILSILFAITYSLLAGFSLPTQRALVALIVVLFGRLYYRRIDPWQCVCIALCVIAFIQPFAILGAGFWLSFLAVAALVGWFYPWHRKGGHVYQRFISVQFILVVMLLLPLTLFVGRASWIAPIINIFAIPVVSMAIVPAGLAGVIVLMWSEDTAMAIWKLAGFFITPLETLVHELPQSIGFFSLPVSLSVGIIVAITLACAAIYLPIRNTLTVLCLLPLIAIILFPKSSESVRLTVLDVGQGLSVVLEVGDKTMIYDTGPSFGESYNASEAIVQPHLRSRADRIPDVIVVSHEDSDHSGGLWSLVGTFPSAKVIHGPGVNMSHQWFDQSMWLQPKDKEQSEHQVCTDGQVMHWPVDTLYGSSESQSLMSLSFLWPPARGPQNGNDSSCVLLVSWGDNSILFTGDITTVVEKQLISSELLKPNSITLLIAPHHGSKTSSGADFIKYISPQYVIFSSGYKHHYGHPHRDIVASYRQNGTEIWSTAEHGAITFTWSKSNAPDVAAMRQANFLSCLTCLAWWR